MPHHYQGYSGNERERRTNERSRKEKEKKRKQKWGHRRKEGDTLSFLFFFFSSFLSLSIQHILTTYNSGPMDGLREIHFGERSLSLSHLYKNDSRRCIPLVLAVVVLLVVFVFAVPWCCWLCGDVDDMLWWELRTPRGDDEPSTSKLK